MSEDESVEPMDKLANKIMLDKLEEQGDARSAWEAVAYCAEKGLPFPSWVTHYLAETAASLLDYLASRDEQPPKLLPGLLGFVGLKKRPPPTNPFHDPHEVYEEINSWLRGGEVRSIAAGAKRYSEEVLQGSHAPETVRGWYNSVRGRQRR